jgi:hypothetical protein
MTRWVHAPSETASDPEPNGFNLRNVDIHA